MKTSTFYISALFRVKIPGIKFNLNAEHTEYRRIIGKKEYIVGYSPTSFLPNFF
jgi:hypothetical protein